MYPHRIKKKCYLLRSCLVDGRRMLLFMVEEVLMPVGEVWLMHNADTQCTVWGERRLKGRKKFMFKYFLSCHRI